MSLMSKIINIFASCFQVFIWPMEAQDGSGATKVLGKIRMLRRQQNTVSRRKSGDPPITHHLIFSKPPYCKILVKIKWTFCLKLSSSLILYPVPRCLMLLASVIAYTRMTSSEFIKPKFSGETFPSNIWSSVCREIWSPALLVSWTFLPSPLFISAIIVLVQAIIFCFQSLIAT